MTTPFLKPSKVEGTCAQFMNLHPDESLKQCPYDKSHMILDMRFMLHLRKCRQAYVKQREQKGLPIEMEICPYNYYHHVPKAQFEKHVNEDCPTGIEHELIPAKKRAAVEN